MKIQELSAEGYEQLVEFYDEKSRLHAFVAMHNTKLGPGLGGIRAYNYKTKDEAITDVLRLAEGMTYKSAMAETGTGGAKAVILLDQNKTKTEQMLLAFAEAVNFFKGNYICAEDLGITPDDLIIIKNKTPYIVGLPLETSSGNPSRFTAFGGFLGVQAALKKIFNTTSLKNRKIAIQGLGEVGFKLAQWLFWEGAHLIVADVDQKKVKDVKQLFGATVVSVNEILKVECDILCPCAMGGILTTEIAKQLKCRGIAGVANNQLLDDQAGFELMRQKILYAPDYVINAGGLINVCSELTPEGYNPVEARNRIGLIFDELIHIFNLSEQHQKPTHQIANEIAQNKIKTLKGKRTTPVVFHHAS